MYGAICAWEQQSVPIRKNVQFPISSHDADQVIGRIGDAFKSRFRGAIPLRIQKVRVMSDLPPALQASARRQLVGDLGNDEFYDHIIYVVQDSHRMEDEMETRISMSYTVMQLPAVCQWGIARESDCGIDGELFVARTQVDDAPIGKTHTSPSFAMHMIPPSNGYPIVPAGVFETTVFSLIDIE